MSYLITEKERKAEEREFKKIQKMIARKEEKELGQWLKRWAREEKRELKKYNKSSKDDWL